MSDLEFMLVAFAVGGAIRVFEERLRRQHLAVALTKPLDREESRQVEEMVAARPFYYGWLLMLLMFASPRRLVDRLRRDLARHRIARRD